jgi:putative membrane protein
MLRLSLAALHVLALGIGLGAVWVRARMFTHPQFDAPVARRVFVADTWWGIAAALWLVTGLWRLFGSTEKSTSYYMYNHVFYLKMALFFLVLILELWPMITLIRWRSAARREGAAWQPNAIVARKLGLVSYAEVALVVCIVFAAVAMARGYGAIGPG